MSDLWLLVPMLLGILALWLLICNQRTFAQRWELYPIPGDPRFWEKAAAYEAVSYDRHLWALFSFQNPERLYPPPIGEKNEH